MRMDPSASADTGRADGPAIDIPPLAPLVQRLIDAPYNTDADRRRLRVFHGSWQAGDLLTDADRARAALQRGAWEAADLEAGDTLDRAEGLGRAGRLADALRALGPAAPAGNDPAQALRWQRLRAQALEQIGATSQAADMLRPVLAPLDVRTQPGPAAKVEAVRLIALGSRLLPAGTPGLADFETLMAALAEARAGSNATYWPAVLAEAQLLLEKDNPQQAHEALVQTIGLNPSLADAWALMGAMAVRAFDFDRVDAIADVLDRLARSAPGASPEHQWSIEAQIIRAHAALRRNDAALALSSAQKILARSPQHPEAMAVLAAAHAERFDFAAAERVLEELDRAARQILGDDPAAAAGGSVAPAVGLMLVGSATSENRQYAEAAELLRRAIDRQPLDPRGWIELGLLQVQAGRDDEALQALVRATELDPFNLRARNSLALLRRLATHESVRSEHFIVRYQPGIDGFFAREMLPILETIHARVAGDGPGGIDATPDQPTLIELLPDHASFAVRIAGMPQLHTFAASTGPVIAMEAPRPGPGRSIGAYDWPRVLQHEYTHTVTLARTRNRIPHWFTEAAAVHVEDAPRDFDRCQLLAAALREKELFGLEEISLRFVRPLRPTDRAQAYAQGHWMYQFIVERFGEEAPRGLMDRFALGEDQARAMESVLGLTEQDFMTQFLQWAGDEVIRWGMLPPKGVPTLQELTATLPAEIAAEAGDDPRAIPRETLQAWLAEHPTHPQLLRVAASEALSPSVRTLSEEDVALLERYANARPVDDAPHRALARHWLRSDTPARAIEHLRFLDAREQGTPAFATQLAELLAREQRWDEASTYAQRAVRLAPFDAGTRELASRVALQRGDLAVAAGHIEVLTVLEPTRDVHKRRLERVRELLRSPGG